MKSRLSLRALLWCALIFGFSALTGGGAGAQVAISQLPNATLPLACEATPIVQSGATKQAPACAFGIPLVANSAPTPVARYQTWWDTSTSPVTLRQYDGVGWVALGTMDLSTHAWTPAGPGLAPTIKISQPTGASGSSTNIASLGTSLTGVITMSGFGVSSWPSIGELRVDNEYMGYKLGGGGTTLQITSRGDCGSTGATHSNGSAFLLWVNVMFGCPVTGAPNFVLMGDGTQYWNGVKEVPPASGLLVGTTDTQTLTNKSIAASEVNSGTLGAAQLPTPTSSTLGGVQSHAAVTHQFLVSILTSGVSGAARPACGDLSDALPSCNNSPGTHIDITGAATLTSTNLYATNRVDASSGAATIALPTSATDGDWIMVRKSDSSANRVTVQLSGVDQAWLSAQKDQVMFAWWGSGWLAVWWNIQPIRDLFTASGTWTKPPLVKSVDVTVIAAGGGGASGRRGAAASIRAGGQGGGGGVLNRGTFNAADLSSTETITVGTGGTAGAAQTVDSTDGNAGGTGGNSSFGAHLVAPGGMLGAAGSTAAGSASASIQSLGGATGLGASASSVSAVSAIAITSAGAGTGGNGGSITAANTDFSGAAGATGSSAASTSTTGGTGGANAGANPGTAGGSISDTVNQFGGAGGGGGGGNASGAGGAGGAGGIPGGGGGGGGASLNGNASGAGAAGARGEVRIKSNF